MELKPIKTILRAFSLLLLAICFSCEEQGWFVNCSDCVPDEPKQVEIKVKLTNTPTIVGLTVYEGVLEDDVVYLTAFTGNTEISFTLSLNKLYTFTASYVINGDNYTAVDSATPKVKYTKDECDDPCYFIYDKVVDLRIKYRASGN